MKTTAACVLTAIELKTIAPCARSPIQMKTTATRAPSSILMKTTAFHAVENDSCPCTLFGGIETGHTTNPLRSDPLLYYKYRIMPSPFVVIAATALPLVLFVIM